MPLMTKSEFAALGILQGDGSRRPVSKGYLSKPDVRSRLSPAMVTDPADGKEKIDSDLADQILKKTRDPARFMQTAKRPAASTPLPEQSADAALVQGSYESERTRGARVKADREELELAERKRELVPVHPLRAALVSAGTAIKEFLQARNTDLSEKAATMSKPREIKAMLDESDRALFEMINNDFSYRIGQHLTGGEEQPRDAIH